LPALRRQSGPLLHVQRANVFGEPVQEEPLDLGLSRGPDELLSEVAGLLGPHERFTLADTHTNLGSAGGGVHDDVNSEFG